MIAHAAPDTLALDDDRRGALERLEDDLRILAGPGHDLGLRLRIARQCRAALAFAAGIPDDAAWRALALNVSAFLARCAARQTHGSDARAAAERLQRLVDEAAG